MSPPEYFIILKNIHTEQDITVKIKFGKAERFRDQKRTKQRCLTETASIRMTRMELNSKLKL